MIAFCAVARATGPGDEEGTWLEVPVADRGALRLLVLADDHSTTHDLPRSGRLVVGRSADADVRIDRPGVSRRHAVLHLDPLAIEDLGSANGTRVREARIARGERVSISPGEAIELGSTTLFVQRRHLTPAAARTPAGETPPSTSIIETGLLRSLARVVQRVAASEITILLQGEIGVGKGVVAERIHRLSARAGRTLLELRCAALGEKVFDDDQHLLENAEGGTIFLDEVGDLSAPLQAKLLGVLQDRDAGRRAGARPRGFDLRFVAATQHDLEALALGGAFRRDLFFRLSAVTVVVPPLREFPGDVPVLARAFLEDAARRAGRVTPVLSGEATLALERQSWPGNVRELRHVIERAVLLGGETISATQLALDPASVRSASAGPSPTLDVGVAAAERDLIVEALARTHGNQTKAARILGISRRNLVNRIAAYGLPQPRKARRSPSG